MKNHLSGTNINQQKWQVTNPEDTAHDEGNRATWAGWLNYESTDHLAGPPKWLI